MKRFLLISLLLAGSASVMAKLPAPVLDDAAKAKAEEAKAKTAHAGKVDAYKLCLSMDRAAASYFKTAATSGKAVKPALAAPACADPGPFVWPAPAAAGLPRRTGRPRSRCSAGQEVLMRARVPEAAPTERPSGLFVCLPAGPLAPARLRN